MARGPKPDAMQAAKGFPGRRKSKAVMAAEKAARLSELLAPAAAKADLPPLLADPKYAPAAAVWRSLAAELRRTHRLPIESEFSFVQYCIYAQEWVESTEELHLKGFTQSIPTIAGGKMERRRPKTFDRQQAFSNITLLSARFGLTPMDMYDLFKGQAAVASSHPELFGAERSKGGATPAAPADAPAASEPEPGGRIGGLSRMRSSPPSIN